MPAILSLLSTLTVDVAFVGMTVISIRIAILGIKIIRLNFKH